jgi:hypothetical protein
MLSALFCARSSESKSRKERSERDPIHWRGSAHGDPQCDNAREYSMSQIPDTSLNGDQNTFAKGSWPSDNAWNATSKDQLVINEDAAAFLKTIQDSGFEIFSISIIPPPQAKKALHALTRQEMTSRLSRSHLFSETKKTPVLFDFISGSMLLSIAARSGLYRGKSGVIAKDKVLFCTSAEEKAQLVSKLGGFVAIIDVDWNSLISASKVANSARSTTQPYFGL